MALPKWLRNKPGALYVVTKKGERAVWRGSQRALQERATALKTFGYIGVPNDPTTCDPFTLAPGQFTRIPCFRDHWEHSTEWRAYKELELELA